MPVYDVESMNITAEALDRIASDIRASKAELTDVEGRDPFGDIEDPDDPNTVSNTLGSFTRGMHEEFDAAAELMMAAGEALRDAVAAMHETDTAAAEELNRQGRS